MKIQWATVVLLAAIGGGMQAAEKTRVDVYISDRDGSSLLLGPGTPLASAIFDKIGVHLNWHFGELPAGRNAFAIRTLEHAPASATPGALAATQVLGRSVAEITVYKDRVCRFMVDHPTLTGVAAGYVLAHELAHLMQGLPRHSESGILKAQWSNDDYTAMAYHKLAFTAPDAELIHQGLVSTASHSAERL